MNVVVTFYSALPCSLEKLEDAVEDALQWRGEIRGAGLHPAGANIDVFFKSGACSKAQAIELLRDSLSEFDVARNATIFIDGEELPLT